ncbi:MAG: PIG-L family deacetylase [Planctomycetes bacterium]|nr:PIG-L family deacetylase [Planctomycetota bacterium]
MLGGDALTMKRALAIGAHPDDIEFMMAGTLLRLKESGWEIHYFNVSDGGLGTEHLPTEEITRLRREESRAACKRVGAVFHESLARDLEIFYEKGLLAKVAAVVREIAPELILTHYPFDYMEDHSNVCRLAVSAAFSRGMSNFRTDPERPLSTQPVALYHAMPYGLLDPLRRPVEPDFCVDITPVINLKTEMLACHKSQKTWLDKSQGQDAYLVAMRDMARSMGRRSGSSEYSEGWIRHLHLGLGPQDFDPLAALALPPSAR